MKKTDYIIMTIITFFLTYFLNYLITINLLNPGEIRINKSKVSQDITIADIRIYNFQKKSIDGLLISVPSSISKDYISTNYPIKIEFRNEDSLINKSLMEISDIPGKKAIHIMFELKSDEEFSQVEPLNLDELNFKVITENDYVQRNENIRNNAILYGIIFSIIYSLSSYITNRLSERSIEKVKKEIQELKIENLKLDKRLDESEISLEKNEKDLNDARKIYSKTKLLLMTRLSEYSKENKFWKDTIRKYLYESSKEDKLAEKLFQIVAENIKTYKTLKNNSAIDNFDEVITLSELMIKNEKS